MKVNSDRAQSYWKGRMEQRISFWITQVTKQAEENKAAFIKTRFWHFNKRKNLKLKIMASYLEIEVLKGVFLEVSRLN